MNDAAWFLLGIAAGVFATLPAVVIVTRRLVRRARSAERRARDSRRMAEIGAMTGGLAHEIKNPLSTIGLNAQLLAEGIQDAPIPGDHKTRLTRRIDALRREAERLRDILSDFLRFAGAVHLEPRPTDLNVVVDELADFYIPQAEAAGVRFRTELAREPLIAPLDPTHFKQALLNLLLNATQAMTAPATDRSGGASKELILRTERVRAEGVDACRVHVIDTGPGIPPDQLERIFEPYYTTKSGGSGLGLPTTRRLVEEHGGAIEVRTEPGTGTDFIVTLPLCAEDGS